jgi:mRNA-degrading endonuclease RelE of RelBE toxin-antitoxin system
VKPALYRLRQGDWRAIYAIEGRTVRVLDLIRRRDLELWLRRRR